MGTEDDPVSDLDSGTFTVSGGTRSGTGGYDDVEAGVQVTVSHEAGTVIGTGYLEPGEKVSGGCQFRFTVDRVPVAMFYKVAVGRRGEISYSHEDLKNVWAVELTLG